MKAQSWPVLAPMAFAMIAGTALMHQMGATIPKPLPVMEPHTGPQRSKAGPVPAVPGRERPDPPARHAQTPAVLSGMGVVPPPFFFKGATDDRARAVACLAAAAWYEAGNDPPGQRSVIQVVLNRLNHPSFPKTICGVVFQGAERKTGCQFTFTCDGSMLRRTPSVTAWNDARKRAEEALDGSIDRSVFQATHYHADYVVPWWSRSLVKLSQIGAHIFYRWPGAHGTLSAPPRPSSEMRIPALGRIGNANAPPLQTDIEAGDSDNMRPGLHLAFPAGPDGPHPRPGLADSGRQQPFLLLAGSDVPNGQWAMAALKTCAELKDCQVLAYRNGGELDRNRRLPASERDRPVFLFIRDRSSGMEIALWDCEQAKRPQPEQCLPATGPELQQLLRDRYS